MAKQGMARPGSTHTGPQINTGTVPEVQGKKPSHKSEMPIPQVYPVIDNDLARDNAENDIPAADLQDFAEEEA